MPPYRHVHAACALLAFITGSCVGLTPDDEEASAEPVGAADDTVEISRAVTAPDIVLDLAESATGWSAGTNTISASKVRQQGSASIGSVGSDAERFRRNSLGPVDARNMRYLTFWYYIDDASKIRLDRDAQVEIASSNSLDTQEMNWNVHAQGLYSGWNFVRLELPGNLRSASGVAINLAAIKRFRLYHFVTASVTTRIDDIRFTNRVDNPVPAGCATVAGDATLQSIGDARSGAAYGTGGCPKSYVVDVRAYAMPSPGGTVVAYSGPNTDRAAVCAVTRVSAFVYRKDPTSGAWEALADRTGSFGTTASGRMIHAGTTSEICDRPYLILDQEYPKFLPGADYRVVMRSERVQSGVREFPDTTLVTPQAPDTPSVDAILARSMVTSDAAVTSLLQTARATSPGFRGMSCRATQMSLVLLDRGASALTAIGVSQTTVTAYVASVRAMVDVMCDATFGSSTFDTEFRTAARNLAGRHNDILTQAGSYLGVDLEVAATMVDSLLTDVFKAMMSQCNPNKGTLAAFVFGGQSPGAPLTQALESAMFVACTPAGAAGIASTKAQQISQAIGSGQGTGFRRCVNDVINKEFRNKCTDPRAIDGTPLPKEVLDGCAALLTPQAQDDCVEAAQKRAREAAAAPQPPPKPTSEYKACNGLTGFELSSCEAAHTALNSAAIPSPREIQTTRNITNSPVSSPLFWTVTWFGVKLWVRDWMAKIAPSALIIPIVAGTGAVEGVTKVQEHELRQMCQLVPEHEKCKDLKQLDDNKKRCVGETLGDRSISYPIDDGQGGRRATTLFDSIDACWCQFLGTPIFGDTCMNQAERERQECLRNPWGPDDAPRPECVKHLHETSGIDSSSLVGAMCMYIQPACGATPFMDNDGDCGCWRVNVDPNPAQACPAGTVVNCGPDSVFDQRSCGCLPFDGGERPWGGNPTCGDDPRFSPGGRDGFITPNTKDLITNRFYNLAGNPTLDYLMVRGGGYVPVVSPALFTKAFANLGTQLDLSIKMPDSVGPSGYRGAVQVLCTSDRVTNRFVGHQDLAGYPLGSLQTLSFPFTQQDLDLCTGTDNAWRLELAFNSDPRTVARTGFYRINWGGSPVSVSSAFRMCPTGPDPGADPVPPISYTPDVIDDAIMNPTTWTLSSGDILRLSELPGR